MVEKVGAEPLHACALILAGRGVLLRGPSGSGKSMLGHELIARARALGHFASWVADDRAVLEIANGHAIAKPVEALAGLAEWYGLGVRPVPHEPATLLNLVVDLVEDRERVPVEETVVLAEGADPLPLIHVPPRALPVSAALVLEYLELRAA